MPEKEAAHKINNLITAQQVRVVGDNIQVPTVVSLKEALAMADEQGLDLVEISPKADNFLKDGDKVKAYVFFRGRQIVFKDQGEILLLRFATDLEEWGKVEQMPKLEGKRMIMILAPKPKK